MPVYNYYAIFTPFRKGYEVAFPDFPKCVASGDDLLDAIDNAEEKLRNYLLIKEKDQLTVKSPISSINIELPNRSNLIYLSINTDSVSIIKH